MELDRPLVLDGGMSNALEDRGHDLSGPLWTARLLRDAPAEIAEVHRAYLAAGADVITTASYQAIDPALLRRSVRLAVEVRDEHGSGRVAASLGPYGALRADGSEYTGRYGVSAAVLRDTHRPRLEALAAEGPDIVAVETVPDVEEAEVIVALLEELGVSAWLSYSVAGRRTRAGDDLGDAFSLGSSPCVLAVGVNCCRPSDVIEALAVARSVTGKPLVAYPNSGESWDRSRRRWSGRGAFDAVDAEAWVAAGAMIVGGCCRVGTAEIAAVADVVRR